MKLRKLKESKTLKNYEIADMLVANGFENEEEGFLDYFLEDNPKYVASVNLEDMGSYVDDVADGEHIPLPYANNADRKILRTEEDVEEFLDFIHDLNYSDMFESAKRNRKSIKEDLDISEDQARYLRTVNSYKKYCKKIIDLASKLEPLYDELENYLTYTPMNKYYLDRVDRVVTDTLDSWSKMDYAELEAENILKDLEKAEKKYPKNQ